MGHESRKRPLIIVLPRVAIPGPSKQTDEVHLCHRSVHIPNNDGGQCPRSTALFIV